MNLLLMCVFLCGAAACCTAAEIVQDPMEHYIVHRELDPGETREEANLLRLDLNFGQTTPTILLAYVNTGYGVYGNAYTAYSPVGNGYAVYEKAKPDDRYIMFRSDYFYYGPVSGLETPALVTGWLHKGEGTIYAYYVHEGELRGRELQTVSASESDNNVIDLSLLGRYPNEAPLYIYKHEDLSVHGISTTRTLLR